MSFTRSIVFLIKNYEKSKIYTIFRKKLDEEMGFQCNKMANVQTAVAEGAAYYAACLTGEVPEGDQSISLIEVCPYSLSVELNNTCTEIIAKNTPYPISQSFDVEA